MDLGDHRLARIDPGRREDRQQRLPERRERLLRLPDVEDVDPARALHRAVVQAAGGSPGTGASRSFSVESYFSTGKDSGLK